MFRFFTLFLLLILFFNNPLKAETKKTDINPIEFGLYLLNQPSEKDMIDVCQSMGFLQIESSAELQMKKFESSCGFTVSFKNSESPMVIIYSKSTPSRKIINQSLIRHNFKEIKTNSSKERIFVNGTSFSSSRTECIIGNKIITLLKKGVPIK